MYILRDVEDSGQQYRLLKLGEVVENLEKT
jgi:hypothetical protein